MHKMPAYVTSILGEGRMVTQTWPDGSHECPFCGYAAVTVCANPGCPASKWATEANRHRFVEMAEKAAAAKQAEDDRRRTHEITMRRLNDDRERAQQARAAWRETVVAAGGCLRCSDGYRQRVRRHRNGCPKVGR